MASTRRYQLGNIPDGKKFGGQAKLIMDQIEGKEHVTLAEVTDAIKGQLETRQSPERVVGFYFSTWKKAGILREIDPVEDDPIPARPVKAAETADEDDEDAEDPEPVPHPIVVEPDKLNITFGTKISDAVLITVRTFPGSTPEQVMNLLNEYGFKHPETARHIKVESVNGSLSNLVRRGSVQRTVEGTYLPL